ncbi:unnamed protein product [Owenia fusiformis]|uniref:Enoyl reductase (ER) domain-containing protein n=1 Tax=Owenia fusiformis TaxID=6347 RepID=A0A8S4N3L8_OWEFU|nr:unnamed protein product [Owenia fusiformis]
MSKMMRAIYLTQAEGKLELMQCEAPKAVKPTDVLLKIPCAGICGSDLHFIKNEFKVKDKVILGHEFAGTVVQVGDGVTNVKVGDRVASNVGGHCHKCRYCHRGKANLCPTGGVMNANGIFRDGAWADFCLVESSQLFKLSDEITFQTACLMEPMSCILNSFSILSPLVDSAFILVAGSGIIGLLQASMLHYKGFRNITITEPSAGRRDIAINLNLSGVKVAQPSDIIGQFKDVDTALNGFDMIIDCTGNPEAIEEYYPLLSRGATYIVFGICPSGSKTTIDPHEIITKETKIMGTFGEHNNYIDAVALVQNMAADDDTMSKMMRAIYLTQAEGKLELVQCEAPKAVKPTDVLLKIPCAGICGSDLHFIKNDMKVKEKVILGHEFGGTVVQVGNSVTNVKVGDRVACNPLGCHCHHCRFCHGGKPNLCPKGGIAYANGVFRDGAWADFCLVDSTQLFRLSDEATFQTACLMEPMACILNSFSILSILVDSASILVAGSGIIGLLQASLLHYRGFRNITITEPSAGRRDIAINLKLNGVKVAQPSDIIGQFKDVDTALNGFDLIFDCTGNAEAIEEYYPLLSRGATYLVFGICPSGSKTTIDPHELFAKETKIMGVCGERNTYIDAVALIQNMAADGKLDLEKLGVKMFPFENYETALSELERGIISKAILTL